MSPFALIYGLMIGTRNALYNSELVKSTKFSLPIRLLSPYINVATLSRGYKRKTKGFRFVKASDNVLDTGDEPLMYARKHDYIVVAVGESRALAIPQMVGKYPDVQTILLDDAFQHRSIHPRLLTSRWKAQRMAILIRTGRYHHSVEVSSNLGLCREIYHDTRDKPY